MHGSVRIAVKEAEMEFLQELQLQAELARARLVRAQGEHDDLLADAMTARLLDLDELAKRHGVQLEPV